MPSIYEVAKEAGVSASTVSRTFNTPHLINSKTRQRVLNVAERLNYKPIRMRPVTAPGNGSSLSNNTAIGFHFFATWSEDILQSNAFYAEVLTGAMSEASNLGLQLMIGSTNHNDPLNQLPRMILDQSIDGLLLVGTVDLGVVDQFAEQIPNIVLVDVHDKSGDYDCVVTDNFTGGVEATRYLFNLGHKRIAFVLGHRGTQSFVERLNGYICAHYWNHAPIDETLVLERDRHADDVIPAIRACLTSKNRPTAVFTANDDYSFRVMQVCYDLGLSIPGDISLIGFDDVQYCTQACPPLTTIRVQKELLGRIAVRQLYQKLIGDSRMHTLSLHPTTIVPVSLVERQSCRAVQF